MRTTGIFVLSFLVCLFSSSFAQPVADFTGTPLTGCAPLAVQFLDNSQGTPTSWKWEFGNGGTSTQKNPGITYLTPGIYTVKLTVTNANGSNTKTRTSYVTVYGKPTVNFTVADSTKCVPFSTVFRDLSGTSIGTISSWDWDFDDGSISNEPNPVHQYNTPGNYNIRLRVTNSGGCSNTLTKLAYIKAVDSIRSIFSFSTPVKCRAPETIRFFNNTTGPGTLSFKWDFGDGNTSTARSPAHTYTTGGLFSISLMVSNEIGCTDTLILRDTVGIKNIRSVINGPDSVCRGVLASFSNGTQPVALSTLWRFDNGSTTFGLNTARSWTTPGTYPLRMISRYSNCMDSVTKIITVMTAPVIGIVPDDSASCKAPFPVQFTGVSQGAIRWSWRFGDGDSSTLQNPQHTYTANGNYTVRLLATNNAGCISEVRRQTLIKVGPPVVIFSDTASYGGCTPYLYEPKPLIVSPEPITAYYWDFGNGATSTVQSPSTTYNQQGVQNISLTTTTADGCVVTTRHSMNTGVPPYVNFGVGDSTQCPGVDVSFFDSSIGATKWLWDFGDGAIAEEQNPTHQYDDTGYYTVKLLAWSSGCVDSIVKQKLIRVLPGRARFKVYYDCADKLQVKFKDSSIVAQTWLWNFGDGTTSTDRNPVHTFASFRDYQVTLTATNGSCRNTARVTVTPINEIANFTAASNTVCKQNAAVFYLSNIKKSNVDRYFWDFGDGIIDSTSSDSVAHIYTQPGVYAVTLTIRDVRGCTSSLTQPNFIKVYGPTAAFNINSAGGCSNKSVGFTNQSAAADASNNIARWVWDFGDGSTQVFSAPLPGLIEHTYNLAGSYYPSLTITDSIGCQDSISYPIPINIYKPIADFFTPNYFTCKVDTVQFRNPSVGTRLSYLWDFGDGTSSTAATPAKTYTANGNYSIKLVVTDAFGCTDSLIKPNYILVRDVTGAFNMSDSISTCVPFQVRFTNTVQNAVSHRWDFGDGGLSSAVNPVYTFNTPGTYNVTLTSTRSTYCVSTVTRQVKVNAPGGRLTYVPLSGCAPLNVAFSFSTPDKVSFIWDFGDGVSFASADSNIAHEYLLPGKFLPKVILKDSAGCIVSLNNPDTISLLSSNVNFVAVDTIICGMVPISFIDSTVSGSPVTGYKWDFGDGNLSTQQNPVHVYRQEGLYSVRFSITTSFGCNDTIYKQDYIRVVKPPSASIMADSSFCGPSTVRLEGNLISPPNDTYSWNWDFGNGNSSSLQAPAAQQFADTGTYNIRLVVTNSSGCRDTVEKTIVIHPIPTLSAVSDTTICEGSSAQLWASSEENYFTWSPTNNLSCINCATPIANIVTDQWYAVSVQNSFGCSNTDSVWIAVKHPFRLSGLPLIDSICAGDPKPLSVQGAENYSWVPATGLSNAAIASPVANPATTTVYKVIGFDSANCFRDSASITLKVNARPSINAGADTTIPAGRMVQLNPVYSGDIASWLWSPPVTLSCSNCPTPVAMPKDDVTYTVKVTNSGGCSATDQVTIRVSCDNSNVFIPTAFTPDGNGLNDVFVPNGIGIYRISTFRIFNRQGVLVYLSGNFNAGERRMGWNGTYKGQPAPAGNYVYVVEYLCDNKKPVTIQGNILLIR